MYFQDPASLGHDNAAVAASDPKDYHRKVTASANSSGAKVAERQNAIYALEPHDVLPVGLLTFSPVLNLFPGQHAVGGVTSALFLVPILRHIFTWLSVVSIDKKKLIKLLTTGFSPAICPGKHPSVARNVGLVVTPVLVL